MNLPQNFKIIGSAHNISEIKIKEKQNCEEIFLSPIFNTNKHKNHLGTVRFNLKAIETKKKIVALGGISHKKLKYLKLINDPEFAGISYFE